MILRTIQLAELDFSRTKKLYLLSCVFLKRRGPRVQGHNLPLKGNCTVAGPPPEEKSSGSGFFVLAD